MTGMQRNDSERQTRLNKRSSKRFTGREARRLALSGAAVAAVALFIGASPAEARNDFANGFENEAGRLLAHTVFAIGHHAIVDHHATRDRHARHEDRRYRAQRRSHHRRGHARPHRRAHHRSHHERVYGSGYHYHHGSNERCNVSHGRERYARSDRHERSSRYEGRRDERHEGAKTAHRRHRKYDY